MTETSIPTDDEPSTDPRASRWFPTNDRSERILLVILGVAVVGLLLALVASLRQPDPYDPIEFEPQRIERVADDGNVNVPTVDGFSEVPAVELGATVPAHGLRCVDADRPVDVLASVWWERMDNPGTRINVVDGFPAVLEVGCVSIRFENTMPADVVRIVDAGEEAQLWRIAGQSTPTAPGGVSSTWTTETFWIVP